MNILFLTPRNSGKNLGGVEGHVRILTEELVKRGHKVKELSLDEAYDKFLAWGYLWRNRSLFRWAEVIHVHDVFWWYFPFAIIKLNKSYKGHKNYKNSGNIYTTFHGWEGVCPPTKSAVWQKRLAQKLSQGTIGVGNFFKKWYGVTPNKVVYGALDSDCHVRQSRTRNDGLSVVFLGRLEEVNGVEVVVEALAEMYKKVQESTRRYKKVPKWEFIFVGDGSYRKQAEKFGKVTGMVKNPQKYLVDADVVIASSYMSMLEAAAMGKPIIAIANNEFKEDYLNCHPLRKWIMVVENSDELIKIITGLYKGPALLWQGRALKDIESAKIWAIKQTPERLADVYEELWG